MQGWLFLTFIMIGSLIGVTGLRQFFIEPLPTTALTANLVFPTDTAAAGMFAQRSTRSSQRYVFPMLD
jgi:hypothetical protein